MITYVRYEQLCKDTLTLAGMLPPDTAMIVGIPRSGLTVAAMIAAHLHLPLAEPTSLAFAGKLLDGGSRSEFRIKPGPVVIVDDSIYAGRSMRNAKEVLSGIGRELVTAVVYANSYRSSRVDYYVEEIEGTRYFEWNLFNHPVMETTLLDIDGVLCLDPPVRDDDGIEYQTALSRATPLYLPRKHKVQGLVTCRLERWRKITKAWLDEHGVRYSGITMAPFGTAAARRKSMQYGRWKGLKYAESTAELLIESNPAQASEASLVSGKPVICPTNGVVYQNE